MKTTTQKRKILAKKLNLESHLVREESMAVLREFEMLEDNSIFDNNFKLLNFKQNKTNRLNK